MEQSEKYKFMRNHKHYGTYEFRFFSPCEHKIENIEKFLNYFFTELDKEKSLKTTSVNLIPSEEKNIQIDFKLNLNENKTTRQELKIQETSREINQDNINETFERIIARHFVNPPSPFRFDNNN